MKTMSDSKLTSTRSCTPKQWRRRGSTIMAGRKSPRVKRHYERAEDLPAAVKYSEFSDFMAEMEEIPTYWPHGEFLAFANEVRRLRKAYDKRLRLEFTGYFDI